MPRERGAIYLDKLRPGIFRHIVSLQLQRDLDSKTLFVESLGEPHKDSCSGLRMSNLFCHAQISSVSFVHRG